MNIEWPDGSGDLITITPSTGDGNSILEISSPVNKTSLKRSVTVVLEGTYDNVSTEFVISQESSEPVILSNVTSIWLDDFPYEISDADIDWQINNFYSFFADNKYDYYDDIVIDGSTLYVFKNAFFDDYDGHNKVPKYIVVDTINVSDYVGKTIKILGGSGRDSAFNPVVAVLDQDMEEYDNSSAFIDKARVVDFEYE